MARRKLLPENTRIHRGYIEFRKMYRGRVINLTWPESKQADAFHRIREILNKIERNEEINEVAQDEITMAQAADLFWDLHAKHKPECDSFPIILARIREKMGSLLYHQCTHENVQAFLDWLAATKFKQERHKNTPAKRLSQSTINSHHKVLVSIFNSIPTWMELEKIRKVKLPKQRNPASLISKPSEEDFTRTRVLSREEFERLLKHAVPSVAAICKMAIFTLLRKSDLQKANLRELGAALRGEQRKTGGRYEIATNAFNFAPLDFTGFEKRFRAAVKAANIKDFQFRDLRRTGATWLFRKENDLGMVQRRLGHASPAMTKKYLGIVDSDNVRASEVLGSILSSINSGLFGEKVGENQDILAEIKSQNKSTL